ncbi:O-antigen polymerase [Janthinobacterium sp. BJB426]|uniref:O-antigen polymerase n=1 Tax=Janthinobacterium sp. BJB426 TaxID=2048010 RepID=UPI0013050BA1|nr:O-antigen polymerase [Janthinobacterium sp. BJB426]
MKYEKSYFNVLVPLAFFQVPIYFVLEPLNIAINGLQGSLFAYTYIYSCYVVKVVIFALVYRYVRPINSRFINTIADRRENVDLKYLHIILIFISYLFMFPIMYEYRDLLATPRNIYESTRTGYGIFLFTSALLNNLSFIAFIFSKKKTFTGSVLFISILFFNIYIHGSKGQFVTILMIYFAYVAYVLNRKMSGGKFLINFGISASLLISLFVIFASQQRNMVEVVVNISNYSDYTRNANMVIDSDFPTQYGKLLIESNLYSRLPRVVYPDKPKDFGYFLLAKTFYPEWFENDSGSPSFGIGGIWADFGIFSIFYFLFWAILLGVLFKTLAVKLKENSNMGLFILVLFFMGIDLIPLGTGYLVVEHLFLAIIISLISSRRKQVF